MLDGASVIRTRAVREECTDESTELQRSLIGSYSEHRPHSSQEFLHTLPTWWKGHIHQGSISYTIYGSR